MLVGIDESGVFGGDTISDYMDWGSSACTVGTLLTILGFHLFGVGVVYILDRIR